MIAQMTISIRSWTCFLWFSRRTIDRLSIRWWIMVDCSSLKDLLHLETFHFTINKLAEKWLTVYLCHRRMRRAKSKMKCFSGWAASLPSTRTKNESIKFSSRNRSSNYLKATTRLLTATQKSRSSWNLAELPILASWRALELKLPRAQIWLIRFRVPANGFPRSRRTRRCSRPTRRTD